jgi:predicted RNA polymerase sigma factor
VTVAAIDPVHELVNAVYLSDSRRLLAMLLRLGRLLVELMPEPDNTRGLLALMLLHDSPKGVTGTREPPRTAHRC